MTDSETPSVPEVEPPLAGGAEAAPDSPPAAPPAGTLIPLAIVLWGPATFVVVLLLIGVLIRTPSTYMALTAFPFCILMIGVAQLVPEWDTPDFALYGGIGLAFLIWIGLGTLYVRVLRELPKRSVWAWSGMLKFMYAALGSALGYALIASLQIMVARKIALETPSLDGPTALLSPIPGLIVVIILAVWHDAMTGPDVRKWLGIDETEIRRQFRSAWIIVVVTLILGVGYWYLALQSYSMGLSRTEQFKLNILPWQDDPLPTAEEWERNQ